LERGGNVLGIDRDPVAIARAEEKFHAEIQGGRLRLVHANHADLRAVASAAGCHEADGIFLDTGLSSDQLFGDPARGFSFQEHTGECDMRMDGTESFSAADLIAAATEGELEKIFRDLGEEPQARKIARAVYRSQQESPVKMTTTRLVGLVEGAAAGCRSGRHRNNATRRVFQSLRMRVNNELESLASALEAGIELLAPGRGRMVAITFESLTDSLVKETFARHAGRFVSLQQGGSRWEGAMPAVEKTTRKAVVPTGEECRANPRAKPAKMRSVRRLGADETKLLIANPKGG
jgi:16S rRNA (cytosine1402-N4)-methyltransferase